MKDNYLKDAVAIFLGAILGAFFIQYFNYLWLWGMLIGGTIGYLVRLLTEPKHCIASFKKSYNNLIGYKIPENFKHNLPTSLLYTVTISSLISLVFIIFGFISFIESSEPIKISSIFLVSFIMGVFAFILGLVFSLIMSFLRQSEFGDLDEATEFFQKYNLISFLFTSIKWILLKFLPFIFKLLIYFFYYAHHKNFVACGIYASILALLVGLSPINTPLNLILATFVGALAGAGIRKIILLLVSKEKVDQLLKNIGSLVW